MKNKDKILLCPNSECFNIPEILYIYNPLDSLIKYKCSFHNNDKNEYQKEQIPNFLTKSLHNIKCYSCKLEIKDNNNFLYCKECKNILCYDHCFYKHKNYFPHHETFAFNQNNLYNNCLEHNNTFIFRCINCQESLCVMCDLCYHNSQRHDLKQLFRIIDDQNGIDKKIAELENQKIYLNKIKEITNKIIQSLEYDINIKERIIENYKNNKFNYQAIQNFNQLKIKNNDKYEHLLKRTIDQYQQIKSGQNKNEDLNSITDQLLSLFYYVIMINPNEEVSDSLIHILNNIINNEREKKEEKIRPKITNKDENSNRKKKNVQIHQKQKHEKTDENSIRKKKDIHINEKEKNEIKEEKNFRIMENDDTHNEIKSLDFEGAINNMIILMSGNIALSSIGNVYIYSMNNLSLKGNDNSLLQKITISKSKRIVKYIYEFPDETLLCSTHSKIFRLKLTNHDTSFNILGLIQLSKSELPTKLISLEKSFLLVLSEQKKLCNIKLFIKNDNIKNIGFLNNNNENNCSKKEEDNISSSENSSDTKNKNYFQNGMVEKDKEFEIYERGKNLNKDKKLICSIFPINKSNNVAINNIKTYEFITTSNYVYDLGDNRIEFYEIKAISNKIIAISRTKKIENISCSTEADSICQLNDNYLCIGLQNFNLNGQTSGFAIVDINKKQISQIIKDNEIFSLNYIKEKNILMASMEVRYINGNYNMIKIYNINNSSEGNIQLNKISQFKSNHKDIIVSLIDLKQENSAPIAKFDGLNMEQRKDKIICASASTDKTVRIVEVEI